MTDYPYPSNFLQPMPGWPVQETRYSFANLDVLPSESRESSEFLKQGTGLSDRQKQVLAAIANSSNVYFDWPNLEAH